MKYFRDKGVQMVDTTCPWVAKVSSCSSRAYFQIDFLLDFLPDAQHNKDQPSLAAYDAEASC
jgi:hypothetical protein